MAQTESAAPVAVGGPNPPPQTALLEQYKQYAGDLANIGTRYTAAQTFYLAVVTALIGVLAFKDSGPTIAQYINVKFAVVMCFIAAVCHVWRQTLLFYETLFHAKFDVLRRLENTGLYTVYATEETRLKGPDGKMPSLIRSETLLPSGLMWIALVLAAASFVYLIAHGRLI